MARTLTAEYHYLIKKKGLTDLMPIYQSMAGDKVTFWVWYRTIYKAKGWKAPKTIIREDVKKELVKMKGMTTRAAAEEISQSSQGLQCQPSAHSECSKRPLGH